MFSFHVFFFHVPVKIWSGQFWFLQLMEVSIKVSVEASVEAVEASASCGSSVEAVETSTLFRRGNFRGSSQWKFE